MGGQGIPYTKNCTKKMKEKDQNILDVYNEVLNLPSKLKSTINKIDDEVT